MQIASKIRIIYSPFYLILILLLSGCFNKKDKKVIVDFNSPTQDSVVLSFHQDEAIHVAIASMSSPKESYRYYNDLLQHIAAVLKIPVHPIQKESYAEVNKILADRAVDLAFICSGAYIDAKQRDEVEILVAPVINNKSVYNAYIIVHEDSPIQSFRDLKGGSFAYTDPLSHTGYNYPRSRMKDMNLNPNSFFGKSVFSYGHDLSIQMVNRNIIDGASVHGLIYNYMAKFNPEKVANTRIIEISEPFGIPPIVVPKNLDPKRKKLYQSIFLNLHKDRIGKQILNQLNIDHYIIVEDEIYDGVRKIKNKIQDENL